VVALVEPYDSTLLIYMLSTLWRWRWGVTSNTRRRRIPKYLRELRLDARMGDYPTQPLVVDFCLYKEKKNMLSTRTPPSPHPSLLSASALDSNDGTCVLSLDLRVSPEPVLQTFKVSL